MRLIDADALIEKLNKNSIFSKITNAEDKSVIDIINEQPTAYDVEVVVEQTKVVFERTVAEILCKTESDFTIADFNIKPFTKKICDVVRKGGE